MATATLKTLTIIKTAKKGQYMNSLEKYHIQEAAKQIIYLNDSQTDYYNPISDVLSKYFK
jgi:hypothetical protein